VAAEQLHEQLFESARRFARLALTDFLNDASEIFLFYAGIALEHLTKAYLASVNPAYIAGGNFESLLHLTGRGNPAQTQRSVMRTIGLSEALKRIALLDPAVKTRGLADLVDVRNGVAHVGQGVEREVAERELAPFLKACDAILSAMGASRSEFWQDLTDVVDSHISTAARAADRRTARKITAARLEFERRYEGIEPRAAVFKVIEDSYRLEPTEDALVDCPACGRVALASGTTDVENWEVDWDTGDLGEPYIVGGLPTVRFYPERIECRLCGLRLEGDDELASANIDPSWLLEDVRPGDFYDPDPYDH
jgi:hypothetical protein